MRAPRAIVASLGASLALVLAGTLALATVSTIVAFNGWPGVDTSDAHESSNALAVAPAAARDGARTARALVVARPAPKPRVQPRRPAVRRATAAPRAPRTVVAPTRDAGGRRAAQSGTGRAPQSVATSVPPAKEKAKPKSPVYHATAPVRDLGNDLGGAVAGAGQGLGGAVSNVSPALGQVVQDATSAVGQTVAGVTKVVADVVDGLTQPKKP